MTNNMKQIKEMLKKAEAVVEQAIELKEENKELKRQIAILTEKDEELDKDMSDFKDKLDYFTSLRDETSIENKIAILEEQS